MSDILYNGVDLSQWNGTVDFKQLKSGGFNFVILRAGYGRVASQKDSRFEEYYRKATEAGLEVGCYWFSYANTPADGIAEANAFLSAVKGKKFSFPCYYDVEDPNTSLKNGITKAALTGMVNNWCKAVEAAGYKAGIYTFYSAINRFNMNEIPYEKWLAKWSTSMGNCSPNEWGCWQYAVVGSSPESTRSGRIPGCNESEAVDTDYSFKDYPKIIGVSFADPTIKPVVPEKSVAEVAKEVWDGKWGNGEARRTKLELAGYNYDEVQAEVERIADNYNNDPKPEKKSIEEIAKEVWDGKWGNGEDRKNRLTQAGYNYDEVQAEVVRIAPTYSNTSQAQTVVAGKKIRFSNVKIYATATSNAPSRIITGNYFIYSDEVIKGRVRITNSVNYVGKTPVSKYVTGWINVSDIK